MGESEEKVALLSDKLRRSMATRDPKISVCCVLFGMSTWILINAVYTQMPIVVQSAPEGWSLPSYFALSTQLANIAPILFALIRDRLQDRTLICFFLVLGTLSNIALAFTYSETTPIFGREHSVYFFTFTFFMATVGCVSSVLFLPFSNKLPETYLVPFFLGEGLSGFVPSTVSLIQGVGRETVTCNGTEAVMRYQQPLFNSRSFFIFISVLTACSTAAFLYLERYSRRAKNEDKMTQEREYRAVGKLSNARYFALLALQITVNAFSNGILPGLQSFSCLPYGRDAYHWAVSLGQISSPLTYYAAFFVSFGTGRFINLAFVAFMACTTYEIITALWSPYPPMVDSVYGVVLIVFVWMLASSVTAYLKLGIAAVFRSTEHRQALFHYGAVTQFGSALGSVISFLVVNYTHLLSQAAPRNKCP